MKISREAPDAQALAAIGCVAARLLCEEDFHALGVHWGYAIALGRDPAVAIAEDLAACLRERGALRLDIASMPPPSVRYFDANDAGLFALVEQCIGTDGSGPVLLELIVSDDGTDRHVMIEQVSASG
ncbi:hypothetical protein ARC20_14650 [Stenotrophomonas panacihumi]|uniref:Uncharacterized protein n=1 Tax=Stenotrophomonas panacihumi TaxID=676599 RepID=A0A0R0A9W0_9GAMM|nr:hypothetical protein [Stenotrophomonas panacihumi]KRG38622.1 hypothetical protein ARC20_14650 [Stenotrophomonas panacihumi]PTN54087.1 hypothetical protein C9J98_12735 [Stenotrophomonas panacihumi]